MTAKLVIWGLATAILLAGIWWVYERGRTAVLTEQAVAAAGAERDRVKNDARLRNLSEYDLCIRGLALSRLPDDACDELRGVASE